MSPDASTRAAVDRLVAAREDGDSLVADQALGRLESALFGKPTALAINRYPLIRKLGEGGAGLVYLAYDPRLDRKVALKLLKGGGSPGHGGGEGRARLMREAQAMARSPHPNVIAVYDVDSYAGGEAGRAGDYLVMEYVEGPDLRRWLAQRRHAWAETLDVFLAAGRGLAAAHEVGVVHRDFKPANVIVGEDGRVRVLDFGLARGTTRLSMETMLSTIDEAEGLDSSLTVEGTVLGTPAYMAPEQHRGAPADVRSDQFAFCVALWEGLYGKRPFEGSTLPELSRAKLDHRPRPPERTRVPGWIPRVLLRGLDPSPEQRWPSMQALLDALSRGATRRRRRVRAFGFALLGALGLGLWLGDGDGDDAAVCIGSDERIAAVWGPAQRDRVVASFAATGLGFAERSAERTLAELDRYAAQWAEAQREACLDTRVRRFASQEILDARTRCLAGRRRELAALVGVLAEADAEVVEHADAAVSALPRIEPCADVEHERALGSSTPDDPTLAAEVERAREGLSRARSLDIAGKVAAGLTQLDELATAIETADYPPLTAEYELVLGGLLGDEGQHEQSVEHLRRAYILAEREGLDALARDAASKLGWTLGEWRDDVDGGVLWLEIADAKLEREPDRTAAARLAMTWGRLEGHAGRYERGLAHYARARELLERLHGPEHLEVAKALSGTAWILQLQHDYDASLATQTEALERLVAGLGPDHPHVAVAHNTIGGTLAQLGRWAEARPHFAEAVRIYEQISPDHPARGPAMANLALVMGELGEHHEAIALLERALALELEQLGPNHRDLIAARIQRAHLLGGISRYADVLDELERAAAIIEHNFGTGHPHYAVCMNNKGNNLMALGRLDEARVALERALEIRVDVFGEKHASTASTWLNLGLLERLEGRPRLARDAFARAHEASPHDPRLAAAYAVAELRLGERDHARALIDKALAEVTADGSLRMRVAVELSAAAIDRGLGDDDRALTRTEAAEKLLTAADPKARPDALAARCSDVARILLDIGLLEQASTLEDRALAAYEAAGNEQRAADMRRMMTDVRHRR